MNKKVSVRMTEKQVAMIEDLKVILEEQMKIAGITLTDSDVLRVALEGLYKEMCGSIGGEPVLKD